MHKSFWEGGIYITWVLDLINDSAEFDMQNNTLQKHATWMTSHQAKISESGCQNFATRFNLSATFRKNIKHEAEKMHLQVFHRATSENLSTKNIQRGREHLILSYSYHLHARTICRIMNELHLVLLSMVNNKIITNQLHTNFKVLNCHGPQNVSPIDSSSEKWCNHAW